MTLEIRALYSVMSSTDLLNWVPVLTTNSPSMPFPFMDPTTTNLQRRFYRVQLGP